jgi:exonuclease III
MKLLSWNCRGLGQSSAVRELKQIILTHKPDIMFLTETKFLTADFKKKANSFGNCFSNHFIVDCTMSTRNRSGGLAMFWCNNVNITIVGYNNNMIDCYVMSDNNSSNWRATDIYGFPQQDKKVMTCELINNLKLANCHDQWLVFGDFNLIMHPSEKQGGRDNNHNIINLALDMLNDCNLVDLGYHGTPFTWTNNQETGDNIKERIDRFCATTSWISRFPRFTNYHLMSYTSDHNPILLVFGTNNDFRDDSHTKNHLKRFENVWIQDPECSQIVQDTWFHETGDTHSKLKTTIDNIHQWGKAKYGNIPSEIKKFQNRIKQMKTGILTRDNINQIHQLTTKLDGFL